jgi:trans-aconitate methyltransferase
MNLTEAQALIQPVIPLVKGQWSDLGCGSGLFTKALSKLLPAGSQIHAVDLEYQQITSLNPNVQISFEKGDMETVSLEINQKGILLANSLHYIREQSKFMQHLVTHLAADGRFIIVEYDSMEANPYVPYPIRFTELQKLAGRLDFNTIEKVNERPSRYGGNMYVALITNTL